jgi:predicted metal-dependent phosphoesterase TrpH
VLTPESLVRRAARRGVKVLALTDHDETGGLEEGARAAIANGIHFVPGVEISATWRGQTIHVLGLGIDPDNPVLVTGLRSHRAARDARAQSIAERLDLAGIAHSLTGARRQAGTRGSIGRNHFARFLVEQGHSRDHAEAFRRYLGAGKPAYVAPAWADISDAVRWIDAAGGTAVLAHPWRCKLSAAVMRMLLETFRQCGGQACEVGAGAHWHLLQQVRTVRHYGFGLSIGSDFHSPGEGAGDVGDVPDIDDFDGAVWRGNELFQVVS